MFDVPGKGFCSDDTACSFVESTVELLQRSKEKHFPRLLSRNSYRTVDRHRFRRQRPFYTQLRKVLICEEDGKQLVFRATAAEVKEEVDVVSDGKMSPKEYLNVVLKKRQMQTAEEA